jgi:molecular chaperone Hsp33
MEQPYQGIVEMLGDSLSHSLANYFSRSAQIQSHIVLLATRAICGGILLQLMPEKTEPVLADDWRRMGLLAGTLRAADLREGIDAGLVGRMFAEDDIRVFQARPAAFRCRCSRERAEEVLQLLGETETTSACKEQGRLEVICEYCGRKETFDAIDIGRLFAGQPQQGSDSLH